MEKLSEVIASMRRFAQRHWMHADVSQCVAEFADRAEKSDKDEATESEKVVYPSDIDKTMVPLLDALNAFPGIRTYFCCEGHGREPFYIWMGCQTKRAMLFLADVFVMHPIDGETEKLYWHRLEVSPSTHRYPPTLHPEKYDGWIGVSARCDELGMDTNDVRRIREINRLALLARHLARVYAQAEIKNEQHAI